MVNRIVLANSLEASDDILVDYCLESHIEFYRGILQNVLSRYVEIIDKYKP